jgi:hypothetical protein
MNGDPVDLRSADRWRDDVNVVTGALQAVRQVMEMHLEAPDPRVIPIADEGNFH